MFKKWLLALCVGGLTLNACAAPDGSAAVSAAPTGPDSAIRKAVLGLVPNASIDSVRPAPMQGF